MTARPDNGGAALVSFRISKGAIRAGLPELPPLVYREAHEALQAALAGAPDPAQVRLPVGVARDLLRCLKAAAYRHTKNQLPHAGALAEAAERLDFAITTGAGQ